MLTYGEITQTYKGMWKVEVTDERGFTVLIIEKCRKADILKWLKEEKSK